MPPVYSQIQRECYEDSAPKPVAALPELPVKTPPPGATIQLLRQAMVLEAYAPHLSAALAKPDAAADFDDIEKVIGELYDSAYDYRVGINLIERSAIDWPDMARIFYEGFRPQLLEALESYLKRGIVLGALQPTADLAVAARFIVETIAWFAIHRHGDPGPEAISNEAAREGVIGLIAASIRMRPEREPREESHPPATPRG